MNTQKKKAFTLAGILIVFAVIAIITAILLPAARNTMPNESLMKFKKANTSLATAIQELVNSDKYYYSGDLGLKADGSLVDDPKYFCSTLADVLLVKSLNCSDKNTGYNSSAVANFADLLNDEIDGKKIYEYADCICNSSDLMSDEAEIVLSDNTAIYTINPYYHFGSKTETGATEEKRLFNLCSKEKRYKFFCMDIDGINQGEPPFGYALRADGKIIYGAKASAWTKASIQRKDSDEIAFATTDSCTPSGLTIVPESDSCKVPNSIPEATCELSENCKACSTDTGLCTECTDGYKLADGNCEMVGCGDLALEVTLDGSKYCITKYNIGDITGLDLPTSDLTLATAGTDSCAPSESNLCCWMGTTSTSCDSENGGYSGCTRTVCDWRAANKICESLTYLNKTWSLPTSDEWSLIGAQLNSISIGQGSDGLMLCDLYLNYSSAKCHDAARCTGTVSGDCSPNDVWTSTPSGSYALRYYLTSGTWSGPYESSTTSALSVRCISKL